MSPDFWLYLSSCLFGSWLVLIVRTIRQNRRVNQLESTIRLADLQYANYEDVRRDLAEKLSNPYPDKDGDGVPDAFQRRKPLSQILEFESSDDPQLGVDTVAKLMSLRVKVEIEVPRRPPKAGEYYLNHNGHIHKNEYDSTYYDAVILHCAYGMNLDDLVEICDEWRKQQELLRGEIDSPGRR